MARPAPGADRVVALLNFLAANPDQSFSLSELCRRLDLNKATAHATTAALADAGYLLRHPATKAFQLGPAVVAVGNAAAARQYEVVDFARDEMAHLADELQVQCVATGTIGDEMVILARRGPAAALGIAVQVGARVPLVPPLGTVFLAWSEPAAIDAWLRRLGPNATDAELDRYRKAVAAIRQRGYSVALEPDAPMRRLRRSLRDRKQAAAAVEELSHEEYILLELEHSASYRVSMIAAPVFGADGRVALALALFGFPGQLPAQEVPRYAERLVEAARTVTKTIHGRHPNHG